MNFDKRYRHLFKHLRTTTGYSLGLGPNEYVDMYRHPTIFPNKGEKRFIETREHTQKKQQLKSIAVASGTSSPSDLMGR